MHFESEIISSLCERRQTSQTESIRKLVDDTDTHTHTHTHTHNPSKHVREGKREGGIAEEQLITSATLEQIPSDEPVLIFTEPHASPSLVDTVGIEGLVTSTVGAMPHA